MDSLSSDDMARLPTLLHVYHSSNNNNVMADLSNAAVGEVSFQALVHSIQIAQAQLRSRHSHEDKRAVGRIIRINLEEIRRRTTSEKFSKLMDELLTWVQRHLQSHNKHWQQGALVAMDTLIEVQSEDGERKVVRLANSLRVLLENHDGSIEADTLGLATHTLGHLARSDGNVNGDFIEFESNRAIEWLSSPKPTDRPERALAAVLVLKEFCENVPGQMYPKNIRIFEALRSGLLHNDLHTRQAGAKALHALLALTRERDPSGYSHRYETMFEIVVEVGFQSISADSIHGALLAIGELMDDPSRTLLKWFDFMCSTVLKLRAHRKQFVRLACIDLIPKLAAFSPHLFTKHFLLKSLKQLLPISHKAALERRACIDALGRLCIAVNQSIVPHLPDIIVLVREALNEPDKELADTVLLCIARIARAAKGSMTMYGLTDGLLPQMFARGLDDALIEALVELETHVKELRPQVHAHLLHTISYVLADKPFPLPPSGRHLHFDKASRELMFTYHHTVATTTITPLVIARHPSTHLPTDEELVTLSLKTLACFSFDALNLLPFVADTVVLYLTHPVKYVRIQAVKTCVALLAAKNDARPAGIESPTAQLTLHVLERCVKLSLTDQDRDVRAAAIGSMTSPFDAYLSHSTILADLCMVLNDVDFFVQRSAMSVVTRLTTFNPCHVLHVLHTTVKVFLDNLALDTLPSDERARISLLFGDLVGGMYSQRMGFITHSSRGKSSRAHIRRLKNPQQHQPHTSQVVEAGGMATSQSGRRAPGSVHFQGVEYYRLHMQVSKALDSVLTWMKENNSEQKEKQRALEAAATPLRSSVLGAGRQPVGMQQNATTRRGSNFPVQQQPQEQKQQTTNVQAGKTGVSLSGATGGGTRTGGRTQQGNSAAATLHAALDDVDQFTPLILPFVPCALNILLKQLSDPDFDVVSASLRAIGKLSHVDQINMKSFLPEVLPLVINTLKNQRSPHNRLVALRTLGKLVRATGHVIEPLLDNSDLLVILLNIIHSGGTSSSSSSTLQHNAISTLGILGALDPFKDKMMRLRNGADTISTGGASASSGTAGGTTAFTAAGTGAKREGAGGAKPQRRTSGAVVNGSRGSGARLLANHSTRSQTALLLDTTLENDVPVTVFVDEQPSAQLSPVNPEYFPNLAIQMLMLILQDHTLVSHHPVVITAVSHILRSRGVGFLRYLSQIMPTFLNALHDCEPEMRKSVLQVLVMVVGIMKQHIVKYVKYIMHYVKRFWMTDLTQVLALVEELSLAFGYEFKPHCQHLVPHILETLNEAANSGVSATGGVNGSITGVSVPGSKVRIAGGTDGQLRQAAQQEQQQQQASPVVSSGTTGSNGRGGADEQNPGGAAADDYSALGQVLLTVSVLGTNLEPHFERLIPTMIRLVESPIVSIQDRLLALTTLTELCVEDGFSRLVAQVYLMLGRLIGRGGGNTSNVPSLANGNNGYLSGQNELELRAIHTIILTGRSHPQHFCSFVSTFQSQLENNPYLQGTMMAQRFHDVAHNILAFCVHNQGTLMALQDKLDAIDDTYYRELGSSNSDEPCVGGGLGMRPQAGAGGGGGGVRGIGAQRRKRLRAERVGEGVAADGLQGHVQQINVSRFRVVWNVSALTTPRDWTEWFRRLGVELLRESPWAALRSCTALAHVHPPLAANLFNAAFLSYWTHLVPDLRVTAGRAFEDAFAPESAAPLEMLQALLNAAEFMEQADQSLPAEVCQMGMYASNCQAYAKALRYKELEFSMSPSTSIANLIFINNQLGQPDAAAGILHYATEQQRWQLRRNKLLTDMQDRLEVDVPPSLQHSNSADPTAHVGEAILHAASMALAPASARSPYALQGFDDPEQDTQEQIQMPWYEQLGWWRNAAEGYDRILINRVDRSANNPTSVGATTAGGPNNNNNTNGGGGSGNAGGSISLAAPNTAGPRAGFPVAALAGKIRCMVALGEYEQLFPLYPTLLREARANDMLNVVTELAPKMARATWALGCWPLMETFVKLTDEYTVDGAILRAATALHHNWFGQARKYVHLAGSILDRKLSALVGESYSRAYKQVVQVQQVAELDEIFHYKRQKALLESRSTSNATHRMELDQSKQRMHEMWNKRLLGCQSSVDVWYDVLLTRTLVLSAVEDVDMWVKFVSICRKASRFGLATRTLMRFGLRSSGIVGGEVDIAHTNNNETVVGLSGGNGSVGGVNGSIGGGLGHLLDHTRSDHIGLMDINDGGNENPVLDSFRLRSLVVRGHRLPQVVYSFLKLLWFQDSTQNSRGQVVHTLGRLVDSIGNGDGRTGLSVRMRKLHVRARLTLVEWRLSTIDYQLNDRTIRDVLGVLATAKAMDSEDYKAEHIWALMNFRAVQHHTTRAQEIREEIGNKYVTSQLVGDISNSAGAGNGSIGVGNNTSDTTGETAPSTDPSNGGGGGDDVVPAPPGMPWANARRRSAALMHGRRTTQAPLRDVSTAVRQLRDEERLAESYMAPAVRGFFRSIQLGNRRASLNVLQDVLRLLTLWFEHGHRENVAVSIDQGFDFVDADTWLGVLPQLIARINIPSERVCAQLHDLLGTLGRVHPHAMIYPLLVAHAPFDPARRRAAQQLLDGLKVHRPKLVSEAMMVSEELIRVAILWEEVTVDYLDEACKCGLNRGFGNMDCDGMWDWLKRLMEVVGRKPETPAEAAYVRKYGQLLAMGNDRLGAFMQRAPNERTVEACEYVWIPFLRVARLSREVTNAQKNLELSEVSPKLVHTKDFELAIPGTYDPTTPVACIQSFHPTFSIMNSKQRPRKFVINGQDGNKYQFLLKGREDLRQDERAMQLFGLINTMLAREPTTSEHDLSIQRYAVVPLSPNVGMSEWLGNTDTLNDLIREYRSSRNIVLAIENKIMEDWGVRDQAHGKGTALQHSKLPMLKKLEVFQDTQNHTNGQDLHRILWFKSGTAEVWLERRTNFSRSLATMSMVGYVLGLGDRHPSNLMLDRESGKIIHIDFGDCFEVATVRPLYPETVPFRLTRMLVNAMEVSGIEGNFRSTCEAVMRVMRENRDSVLAIFEAFVHDPLLSWRLKLLDDVLNHTQRCLRPDLRPRHEFDNNNDDSSSAEGAGGGVADMLPIAPQPLRSSERHALMTQQPSSIDDDDDIAEMDGVSTNQLPTLPPPPMHQTTPGIPVPLGRQRSYTVADVKLNGPGGIGSLISGSSGGISAVGMPPVTLTAAEDGSQGTERVLNGRVGARVGDAGRPRTDLFDREGGVGGGAMAIETRERARSDPDMSAVGMGMGAGSLGSSSGSVSMRTLLQDNRGIVRSYDARNRGGQKALNHRAKQVVNRIDKKLSGTDFDDDTDALSVKAQVGKLIENAMLQENLCQLYAGWCPYW